MRIYGKQLKLAMALDAAGNHPGALYVLNKPGKSLAAESRPAQSTLPKTGLLGRKVDFSKIDLKGVIEKYEKSMKTDLFPDIKKRTGTFGDRSAGEDVKIGNSNLSFDPFMHHLNFDKLFSQKKLSWTKIRKDNVIQASFQKAAMCREVLEMGEEGLKDYNDQLKSYSQ